VLGDPRLRTRGYGRLFLASLPPMTLLEDIDEVRAFAASLAPFEHGTAMERCS